MHGPDGGADRDLQWRQGETGKGGEQRLGSSPLLPISKEALQW